MNHQHQNQYPANTELQPQEAFDILFMSEDFPTTRTLEGVGALDVVDRHGDLQPLTFRSATPGASYDQNLQTTISELPLATYQDGDEQHDVKLYSRIVTGMDVDAGPSDGYALFVVDQATAADGTKRLAATPAVLYRSDSGQYGERSDGSQLTLAVLRGAQGADGIKQLIAANKAGDTETTDRIRTDLEAALRQRAPERVTNAGFNEASWELQGVQTPRVIARQKAEAEFRAAKQDKEWQGLPKHKKVAAWVMSRTVKEPGYSTPKAAHFSHQRRRAQG